MENFNSDELKKIVENSLREADKELSDIIYDVVLKIVDLKEGKKTSIAELINYDSNTSLVDPLTQGTVSSYVDYVCSKIGIKLERKDRSFGGLAYFNKFVKTGAKVNVVVPTVKEIIEHILQKPVGFEFTLDDMLRVYPSLDDKKQRELAYSVCNWLEKNNFIDLKVSTNDFNPYGEECVKLLTEGICLKKEKEGYLKFCRLSYEYKCELVLPRNSKQFKISKEHLAYWSEQDSSLYIVEDSDAMVEIYKEFLNFAKKTKKQKYENGLATGTICESCWREKKLFRKTPDAELASAFFVEVLKKYGCIE